MSDSWQSAWVEVLPDFSNFRNQTNQTITPILSQAGNTAGSKFGLNFVSVLGGVLGGNILTGIGYTLGRVFSDAVSAGVQYGLDSIQLASDLQETVSAVGQIFGESSDEIVDWADTAVDRLGQTRTQALTAIKTFGALGNAAGLTDGDLIDFSTSLVELATDLASFNNTDVDTALTALRSGLSGESEPLRQYQVFLNDATLKAKALELGIYDGTGALSDQQRILAAYNVVLDKTTIQQGDFARTSDGLAQQQKILAAALKDSQTQLGTYLLPGFTSIVTFANDSLLPKLGEIIDRVGPKFAAALQEADVEGLLEDLGPAVEEFAELAAEDGIPAVIDLVKELIEFGPKLAESFQGDLEFLKELIQIANGDFTPIINGRADGKADPVVEFFSTSPAEHIGRLFGYKTSEEMFEEARRTGRETGETFSTSVGTGLATFNPQQVGAGLGENFSAGLAFGISKGQSGVITAATKVAQSAVSAVKSFLKISSPSKVMAELGAFAAEGFSMGWDQSRPIMTPGVRIPTVGAPALGSASGSSSSETTLNLNGVDPASVYQLIRQDLGGKLATL